MLVRQGGTVIVVSTLVLMATLRALIRDVLPAFASILLSSTVQKPTKRSSRTFPPESTPPPRTSPFCLMVKQSEKVKDLTPYDDLVKRIEELNLALGKEMQKFKLLKKIHTTFSIEFEELSANH